MYQLSRAPSPFTIWTLETPSPPLQRRLTSDVSRSRLTQHSGDTAVRYPAPGVRVGAHGSGTPVASLSFRARCGQVGDTPPPETRTRQTALASRRYRGVCGLEQVRCALELCARPRSTHPNATMTSPTTAHYPSLPTVDLKRSPQPTPGAVLAQARHPRSMRPSGRQKAQHARDDPPTSPSERHAAGGPGSI
jgi:hypothetical protein